MMRIFVAGATGVLGIRLLPLMKNMGHTVAGMTRSPEKVLLLNGMGVKAVLCNVYDLDKLRKAVTDFQPDLIIDQLTDLPDSLDNVAAFADANNRIRKEGTENLIAAARDAGSPIFLAQSVAWELPEAGDVAVNELEKKVLEYGGTVLRYGKLYGPGTYYKRERPAHPRIHVDRAAEITVEHLYSKGQTIEITEEE